ncbi:YciI family protein [Nocardia spumae]|uniref:YciI family protein n=1 Tax=Nocardia spumae TaxID=2887190 RepID=UPI001D1456DC|nr:YciI family protein [Nocardia spumae]
MFVVLLTYTADLDTIDSLIPEHAAWLDANYAAGVFVASGPRVPRTGGVIVADIETRAQLDAVLTQDPFGATGAATYEVIEFVPTKTAPALSYLVAENT